ncbi:MAG: DEAD/DEAH box helicase [Candidatus Riflebacteria bacterium]|nr:DEAD/DEAH box helicase [Candidatus Riflebacteria bacterium]
MTDLVQPLIAGDAVEIDLDPEWLPLDALPLQGCVAELMEALGNPPAFSLAARGRPAVELRRDVEEGFLTGPGLSELFGPAARQALLRLRSVKAPVELEVLPEGPLASLEASSISKGTPYSLDPDSLTMLAEALSGRRRPSPLAPLHAEAMDLSLAQALDVLIGEGQLRDLTPFEYQRRVVRRVMAHLRGQAMLADEVGLGKTIEAAMTLVEYRARGLARQALVLVPPALVGQWADELRRHFNLPVVTQDEAAFEEAGDAAWHRFPVLVASLATAKREPNRTRILAEPYDLVIVDEAHHLRNATTQAWKFVNALQRRFLLLLTATPVQNDLKELFNLVTLLRPGQLGTYRTFRSRYVATDGARNVEDLRALLAGVMIRNRRSDTGLDLPPRTARTLSVAPTDIEARIYRRVSELVRGRYRREQHARERLELRTLQLLAGSSPAALAASLAHRDDPELGSLTAVLATLDVPAKTLRFLQTLQELEGEKAVIFTQFRATLAHLAAFLERTGFTFATFQSGMSRTEKDRAVADFAGDTQLLLCTEIGSEGRNLQFCRNLINFDLPWNPMRIEQRLGRLHRIGQTREVRIVNLVTRGTLEHELIDVLERKLDLFQLVVGEMDLILGDVEEEAGFEEAVFDAWAWASDESTARGEFEAIGDRLQEAKKAVRFQEELNETLFGNSLALGAEDEEAAGG